MDYFLRRVPLSFSWPMYVAHNSVKRAEFTCVCPDCKGSGNSKAYDNFYDQWLGDASFKPEDNGSIPFKESDPEILELAAGQLNNYYTYAEAVKLDDVQFEAYALAKSLNSMLKYHLNGSDITMLQEAGHLPFFDKDEVITVEDFRRWSLSSEGISSVALIALLSAKCHDSGVTPYCISCLGYGDYHPLTKLNKTTSDKPAKNPMTLSTGIGYQAWSNSLGGDFTGANGDYYYAVTPVFQTPKDLAMYLVLSSTGKYAHLTYDDWIDFIYIGMDMEAGDTCLKKALMVALPNDYPEYPNSHKYPKEQKYSNISSYL